VTGTHRPHTGQPASGVCELSTTDYTYRPPAPSNAKWQSPTQIVTVRLLRRQTPAALCSAHRRQAWCQHVAGLDTRSGVQTMSCTMTQTGERLRAVSYKANSSQENLAATLSVPAWQHLVDDQGNTFKNQGDCVSYVAANGKNKGAG
jgi:hypothetical protein